MKTAKEAREQIVNGENEKSLREWNQIEAEIDNAIDAGKFSVTVDGRIYHNNRTKLERLGYKVVSGSQYNESFTSISW